ncbi:winged helix-turn-helix transcriptional regulator [Streptomyces sp. NPDC058067]|uniref:winged helix-turn-helix transcriptional regulator n=1 Tax=Streptomyces sp. NPDC058067 TaxID=3346324 RepID=UPI0036ED9042
MPGRELGNSIGVGHITGQEADSRITPKVLRQSLQALEHDGLIVRTVHAGPARHVEYELTSLGRSLLGLLDAARSGAEAHLDELIDAREAASPANRSS